MHLANAFTTYPLVVFLDQERIVGDIIETAFGTPVDPKLMALGSASRVERKGAFFVFSIRLDQNDIREYSFTERGRAETMRSVLISHLEEHFRRQLKKATS